MTLESVPPPALKPVGVRVRTAASLISAGTEKMLIDLAQKSYLGKARARTRAAYGGTLDVLVWENEILRVAGAVAVMYGVMANPRGEFFGDWRIGHEGSTLRIRTVT